MPATSVKPRSIRLHSTDLCCDVRRSIGHAAYCACGWEGSIRRDRNEARADARAHVCEALSSSGAAEAS